MISSHNIKTYLYWFLIGQICLISISIAASSLLLALIITSLVLLIVVEKKWLFPKIILEYAFLAYIAIEFITALNSDHLLDALKNSKRLLLISIVYAAFVAFDSREKIMQMLKIFSTTISLLSLVEIFFYFNDGYERLYMFQHYMTTGGLKMIACLLFIPFILGRDGKKNDRIFFAVTTVPIFVALILTNTRSAWLGLIFGLIVIGLLYYRTLFIFLSVGIVLFFLFAPEQQVLRAKSVVDLSNPTNISRMNMWKTGIEMWKDKPLLGFGDIDLYQSYLLYRTPTGDEPAGHLHNNFIHLLVTLGIVGLSIVVFLFYSILKMEYEIFQNSISDALLRNITIASIGIFCAFLINGLFEWNFGDHEIMVFVWFSVGLCLSINNFKEIQPI